MEDECLFIFQMRRKENCFPNGKTVCCVHCDDDIDAPQKYTFSKHIFFKTTVIYFDIIYYDIIYYL